HAFASPGLPGSSGDCLSRLRRWTTRRTGTRRRHCRHSTGCIDAHHHHRRSTACLQRCLRRGKRQRSGRGRCSGDAVLRDGSAKARAFARAPAHPAASRFRIGHHDRAGIAPATGGEAMKTPRAIFPFSLAATLIAGAFCSPASSRITAPLSTPDARPADDASKPSLSATSAAAHAAASGDILLESLLTELDRSRAQLKMDQVAPPYYIEYRVNDVEDYAAEAAFGALRENQRVHYRVLRVVVRIGDYKQDSYYSQGMGEAEVLPLDDDPIALRHQIW